VPHLGKYLINSCYVALGSSGSRSEPTTSTILRNLPCFVESMGWHGNNKLLLGALWEQ
jgi:hypothetical protein